MTTSATLGNVTPPDAAPTGGLGGSRRPTAGTGTGEETSPSISGQGSRGGTGTAVPSRRVTAVASSMVAARPKARGRIATAVSLVFATAATRGAASAPGPSVSVSRAARRRGRPSGTAVTLRTGSRRPAF